MGMGKGSSTTTVQMTPEQQEMLRLQTGALRDTFLPAYQNTVTGAKDILGQTMGGSTAAAQNASNVASQAGALQGAGGASAYLSGLGGQQGLASYQQNLGQGLTGYGSSQLAQLFSPAYKQEQIQASLQPAREAAREAQAGQNAMYGGAGGLGSSRMALADRNLRSLNQQRMQSTVAQTSAAIENQRQQAANTLLGTGTQGLSTAGNLYGNLLTSGLGAGATGANIIGQAVDTSGKAIGYAQSPMDLYNKYASVVYGTPQASTTANFAGTQGANTSSKGFRI